MENESDHMFNHDLRLRRASYHLQRFENEVRQWMDEGPYQIVSEPQPEQRQKVFRVEILSSPPPELGLLIGDYLHNLRSALDNLAYDLARAHRGGPLSRSVAKDSQFPIFKDRDQFMSRGMNQIRGVAPEAQKIIEELQPYQRGNEFAYDRLWWLRELSNNDKHRLLQPMLLYPTGVGMAVSKAFDVFDVQVEFGPVEHGAVIARAPYSDAVGAEIDVPPHIVLSVGLEQGSPIPTLPDDIIFITPVVQILRWIHRDIATKVVPPLNQFLRR
jgi:hypothetical protein